MGVRLVIYLCFLCYFLQYTNYPFFDEVFGLSYIGNHLFSPLQLVSYGFLHVDIFHIGINLIVITLFGTKIDQLLGTKNFLFLFLMTVFGGAMFQTIYNMIIMNNLVGTPFPNESIGDVTSNFEFMVQYGAEAMNVFFAKTLGASAGSFGCLVAFTILFPRDRLHLFFLPISISARLFAILYILLELYNAFYGTPSNIAHFAHLGGAVFGLIIGLHWKKHFNI